MKGWLQKHGFTAFLGVACMALSVEVVLLGREVRALRGRADAHAAESAVRSRFVAGEPFFPFTFRDADGELREFDPALEKGGALLFVLANACPLCDQTQPRWEEAAPHFQAASVRVLALLLDGPSRGEGIPGVPTGSFADLSRLPLAKLETVPLTVLLDGRGTVAWVHYGTLTDARLAELVAHLP